jgi:YHS domain-containing protein
MIMPVDPVCGIEMDEDLATIHEYNGKKYYFCCEGCKSIFSRKPRKYLKNQ